MERERTVKVGIVGAETLHVFFHSAYQRNGETFVGECCFTLRDAGALFVPVAEGASFTLKDVTIGIGFHWERQEAQTFCGALQLIEEGGLLRAVNVVPVETYLTSVISSEMSANASLELLKAHAVISRSWLLVMMDKRQQASARRVLGAESGGASVHEQVGEGSLIRWYDSEAHILFDVCADDHCQRYQGITRQVNPQVEKALRRGRDL